MSLDEFYQQVGNRYETASDPCISKTSTVEHVAELLCSLNMKVDRILDIGGNRGDNLFYLSKKLGSTENVVLDIYIPQHPMPGLRYIVGDALSVENSERDKFDIVLLMDILEHVADTDRLIENARSYVSPNGFIVLTTPNLSSLVCRISLLLGFLPPPMEVSFRNASYGRFSLGGPPVGHIRVFTYNALVDFSISHGLTISKISGIPVKYCISRDCNIKISTRLLIAVYNIIETLAFKWNPKYSSEIVFVAKWSVP